MKIFTKTFHVFLYNPELKQIKKVAYTIGSRTFIVRLMLNEKPFKN